MTSSRTRARSKAASTRCSPSLANTNLGDIAWVPGPDLIDPKGVRDVAEWYMLTASRPDVVHKIFERQVEVGIDNLARIRQRLGDDAIDVIFLCGDGLRDADVVLLLGQDVRTRCGSRTTPSSATGFTSTRRWKTFKHSCGSSERFFESMIDAGIDIINPVQCSAKGMDPRMLKEKYKGRLVFWGGGVDTQRTLPFGTPAEVRAEVLERCEIFSQGGGFVFNAIHNVQASTPVENMVAMFEAVKEFNGRR